MPAARNSSKYPAVTGSCCSLWLSEEEHPKRVRKLGICHVGMLYVSKRCSFLALYLRTATIVSNVREKKSAPEKNERRKEFFLLTSMYLRNRAGHQVVDIGVD